MPCLFEEETVRATVRIPSRLLQKAMGKNRSKLVARSLEQFLGNPKLAEVVDERDGYQGEMERLASVVKEAKKRVKALEKTKMELSNLKRSITQTLRHALGTEKASALRLYRRCVNDLNAHEHDIAVIEAHLVELSGAGGAA